MTVNMNGWLLRFKILSCILFITICSKGQFSLILDTLFLESGDSVFMLKYTTDPDTLFLNNDTLMFGGAGGDTCLWYYVADDTIKTYHNVWVDSSLNMKYTSSQETYYFLNGDAAFGNAWPNMAWGFNDPYNDDSSGAVMINHSDGYRINLTTRDLTYESTIAISNDGVSMWAYLPSFSTQIDMTVEGINIQSDTVIVLDADSIFAQVIPEETKGYLLMIDGNTGKITKVDTADIGGMGGDSYWTLSGNHLYPDNTTDSVVIGDNTALAPFTLAGHMSFTGEGVIRTPDNGSDPAQSIYIYGGDGDPDGGIFLNIGEDDDIKGEVFIGQVNEETTSDSIVTIDERGALGWTQRLWGSTGNYIYQNTITDSVGIGIATPEGALHVAKGDVRLGNSAAAIKPKIINDEYPTNYLEFDVSNLNVYAHMTVFYNDTWVQDTLRLGSSSNAYKLFLIGTYPNDTLCAKRGTKIYRLIPPR